MVVFKRNDRIHGNSTFKPILLPSIIFKKLRSEYKNVFTGGFIIFCSSVRRVLVSASDITPRRPVLKLNSNHEMMFETISKTCRVICLTFMIEGPTYL
jgi:hypothetical protein